MFDLPAKRELNNGFGNALSSAVELAVTPVVMALIGWRLDLWLGTTPVLLVFLAAFTLGYVLWKQYRAYQAAMIRQEQELLGPSTPRRAS